MDYLTRRSVAALGCRGAFFGGRSNHPHLSALGVRVERGTVERNEIAQALADVGVSVALSENPRIPVSEIESMLSSYAPDDLREKISAFLDGLAEAAAFDLVQARSRGVEEEILAAEGGCADDIEFAAAVNCSVPDVLARAQRHEFFCIEFGGLRHWPRWQLGLAGLSEVLTVLSGKVSFGFSIVSFFTTPTDVLSLDDVVDELADVRDDDSPLSLLRRVGDLAVPRSFGMLKDGADMAPYNEAYRVGNLGDGPPRDTSRQKSDVSGRDSATRHTLAAALVGETSSADPMLSTREKLKRGGYKIGSADEFLGLSTTESKVVDRRLKLRKKKKR